MAILVRRESTLVMIGDPEWTNWFIRWCLILIGNYTLAFGLSLMIRWWMRSTEPSDLTRMPELEQIPKLDEYQVACLVDPVGAGREDFACDSRDEDETEIIALDDRLAEVLIVNLVQAGGLSPEHLQDRLLELTENCRDQLHPVETTFLNDLKSHERPIALKWVWDLIRSTREGYRKQLTDLGLLISQRKSHRIQLISSVLPTSALLALLGFEVIGSIMLRANEQPLLLGWALPLIPLSVVTFGLFLDDPSRTRRGDRLLKELCTQHESWKRSGLAPNDSSTRDEAMAVALFGTEILQNSPRGYLDRTLNPSGGHRRQADSDDPGQSGTDGPGDDR